MPNVRLMMLGLDAVSLPFIRENLDTLPNLEKLLLDGHLQDLGSTADYLSASVWPTFSSGVMPGHHGQYFPMQWDGGSQFFRRITEDRFRPRVAVRPFWHDLADQGLETIALDIAHIFDDERAPGLQISNWSQQSFGKAAASDRAVLDDIRCRFGKRPIGKEVPVAKSRRECIAIRKSMVTAAKLKGEAIRHLMDRPWDFFVVGMYEAHRAGHNLWPVEAEFASASGPDAMLSVYQETDRQVGLILEKLKTLGGPEPALVVFSLHGLHENTAQDHFLSEIMHRLNAGYLGLPAPKYAEACTPNLMAYLRKLLPAPLQYRLAALVGETVQDAVVNRALTGGYDWSKTPAFPVLSGGEGLIRLNIAGRERQGYLQPGAEAERYTDWLIARLREIRVERTEEPLVADVLSTDEVFPGPRRDLLPDLILRWKPEEPATAITSPEIGRITTRLATGRGGNHNAEAFLIAWGSAAVTDLACEIKHIADLAELACRAFGQNRTTPQIAAQ